jgi:hypothetical protein
MASTCPTRLQPGGGSPGGLCHGLLLVEGLLDHCEQRHAPYIRDRRASQGLGTRRRVVPTYTYPSCTSVEYSYRDYPGILTFSIYFRSGMG